MEWIPFALLNSVAGVGTFLLADYLKIRGFDMAFWTRIFVLMLLLPSLFFLSPPTSPFFYIFSIMTGVCYFYNDLVYNDLAAQKGAGLATRIKPLSAWITFFLWTAVTPSLLMTYIDNPVTSTGIIFSMFLCGFFAMRLKKCAISWSATIGLIPFMFFSAFGQSFGKAAIDQADAMISGTTYYVVIQSLVLIVIYLLMKGFLPRHTAKYSSGDLLNKKYMMAGFLSALVALFFSYTKFSAYWHVDNPAYVSVFALLGPFWVLLLKKFRGEKEEGDVLSGLGMVISCIFLVICTKIL